MLESLWRHDHSSIWELVRLEQVRVLLHYQVQEVLVLAGEVLEFLDSIRLVVEREHLELPLRHLSEVSFHSSNVSDSFVLEQICKSPANQRGVTGNLPDRRRMPTRPV